MYPESEEESSDSKNFLIMGAVGLVLIVLIVFAFMDLGGIAQEQGEQESTKAVQAQEYLKANPTPTPRVMTPEERRQEQKARIEELNRQQNIRSRQSQETWP